MTTVVLRGCRTTPLGSYLKALGVFRLVSEQVDPSATCRWQGDALALDSSLAASGLREFLAADYRPTPVLSPWNKDAGFKGAGSEHASSTATKTLRSVEQSDDPRLARYRIAISVVDIVRSTDGWDDLGKAAQVTLLRNALPDDALGWLDATVVLRGGDPVFPAILGSGGNFGRLELSPTFVARLLLVFDQKSKKLSHEWLSAALYEDGAPALRSDAVGQFDPGAAGGIRSDAVGKGDALTNPWDLILTIEGALLWCSGVARRLGSAGSSMASMPFTVAPSSTGEASMAPGEKAKAEIWTPIWTTNAGLGEIGRLFAEGRISWSGHQARTGLDARRAMSTLGTDAGIAAFERHVVAERMGQSPLAVPLGRFIVADRPAVSVLSTVDRWCSQLRRVANSTGSSQGLARAAQRVDRTMFAAASGRPADLQNVLIAIAEAEAQAGRTEEFRAEPGFTPVGWLAPDDWLSALDDGSRELRIAASIAIANDRLVRDVGNGAVRCLVRPIRPVQRGRDPFAGVEWSRAEARVRGFGVQTIDAVLADLLVIRSEAECAGPRGHDPLAGAAPEPWFPAQLPAGSGDAEAMASGSVDLARLGRLVSAMLLLAPDPESVTHRWRLGDRASCVLPAWRVLAPFYSSYPVRVPGAAVALQPQSHWARALAAGKVADVLTEAIRRLRMAGLTPRYRASSGPALAAGLDAHLLAAALMCGATRSDIRQAAAAVTTDLARPDPANYDARQAEGAHA